MGDFALDAWEGKPLSLCCPVNPPHVQYHLNLNERGWNAATDRACFAAHSWHNRHTRRQCFRWSDRRMPDSDRGDQGQCHRERISLAEGLYDHSYTHALRAPGYRPHGRCAPITGLLTDVEVRGILMGRAQECTISPEFIDGLLREGDPTMIPPTEKALMQTAIGEGHRSSIQEHTFCFIKN